MIFLGIKPGCLGRGGDGAWVMAAQLQPGCALPGVDSDATRFIDLQQASGHVIKARLGIVDQRTRQFRSLQLKSGNDTFTESRFAPLNVLIQ